MALAAGWLDINVGAVIELFTLDDSEIGGSLLFHWAPGPIDGQPVIFDAVTYNPVPIETDGFDYNGRGKQPMPRLRINNLGGVVVSLLPDIDGLLGAKITRKVTLDRYLDGRPGADPTVFAIDVFRIERLAKQNRTIVEWELTAATDQEGRRLPGRQMLRDTCGRRYRRWNGSAFDYTKVSCPYNGASYFNAKGESTVDPAADKCGKLLADCAKRFPNEPLPTWAFPGMARVDLKSQ
jgi:lambda family phage minor tail protein L